MEVVQSSASSSTSLLHRLPAALFVLVTQHLPLPDKLLHLTHVCRTLPSLTPLSFAFDTLAWTRRLLTHLSSSPPPPLLSLLSLVPFALFTDTYIPSISLLFHLLHSPAVRSSFPALRAVTMDPCQHWPPHYHQLGLAVISALRLCPHLTALDLQLRSRSDADHQVVLSQLPSLRSLRHLRLREASSTRLSSTSLRVLLSLPLITLDLRSVAFADDFPPPSLLPVSSTLRTLLLPRLFEPYRHGGAHALVGQWERALLSSFGAQREDGEVVGGLQRLLLSPTSASNLSCLSRLRHLHTLQLDVVVSSDDDVATFLSPLVSARLPLRHVRLKLRPNPEERRIARSVDTFTVLTAFISAYTGQLETLELPIDAPRDFVLQRDEAEALTSALLSCRSLRRLQIQLDWLSPLPSTTLPHCLPHLEALELRADEPLDESTLATLLDAAPHLRELTLEALPLPWEVLLWVGERVHELRTLVVISPVTWMPSLNFDRWRPPVAGPALPHLTILVLGTDLLAPHLGQARVFFLTLLTAYLVHSAPALRYLTVPLHIWLDGYRQPLALLGGLTELRGISTHGCRWSTANTEWLREPPLSRYWEEEAQSSRLQRGALDGKRCLWGEEAWPTPGSSWTNARRLEVMRNGARGEEEVLAWVDSAMPRFRAEVDGMAGSVAFFAALKSHPISQRFFAPPSNAEVRQEDGGKQCCAVS